MTTTDTTDQPPVLKAGDPGEVLGLLGVLLGFQPEDSLVVIALTGARQRVTFQIRSDLTDPEHAPRVASLHADHLLHHGAESVLVFALTDDPDRADATVAAVHAEFSERGIPIQAAARAHDGWYWTYDECGEPGIDPPRPYDPQSSPKAVEAIVHGATVAPSREAMIAEFDGPSPSRAAELMPAYESAAQEVERFRSGHTVEALIHHGIVVQQRLRRNGASLSDEDAARLAAWIGAHLTIRDDAWEAMSFETAADDLVFWQHVLTRTIAPYEPPVACLTGVAAWLQGNGAVARTLWERALAVDPEYSMAQTLIECLDRGVGPRACTEGRSRFMALGSVGTGRPLQ